MTLVEHAESPPRPTLNGHGTMDKQMPGPGHRQATPASQGFHKVNAPGQEGVKGAEQAQFHAALWG